MLYEKYPVLEVCRKEIEETISLICAMYHQGGKLLLCGNGGSCADCDHIVGELMKGFLLRRPLTEQENQAFQSAEPENWQLFSSNLQRAVPAISLCAHRAVSTAFDNDVVPELGYAQLMFGYASAGDLALGISTSGNSGNVVNAMVAAKAKGIPAIGLTGQKACKMDAICDVVIKVPATCTPDIQEYHLPVYHYICQRVEACLFGADQQK